ncbi:MAG: DUF1565 domain-containing protein, partial [FCB group bacterium]|nr:DUF1565 domain-containing protein [FCB group bacterium]
VFYPPMCGCDGEEYTICDVYNLGIGLDHEGYCIENYDGPVWHIAPNGSDETGDGSEDFPFASIQHGLWVASESDTVQVAEGTYFENIFWPPVNGIKLLGSGSDSCIIDGDSLGSVIRFENQENEFIDTTTVISNFTIQHGYAQGEFFENRGGGIFCELSSPRLTDLIITSNSAHLGGGIALNTTSGVHIDNVELTGNFSSGYGGGLYAYASNVVIENTSVFGNTSSTGGGLYFENASPQIRNSVILNNVSRSGGGMQFEINSYPVLENVTITGNRADRGGGILCQESYPILAGVRITGNAAAVGGGMYIEYSNLTFSNENLCSIFLNNSVNPDRDFGRSAGVDLYSDSEISVVVDTFTVLIPTDYHASPLENYTFDILNAALNYQVDADLYISPDGSDENDGLTPETPLQTIRYAMSVVLADSLHPHVLYLANGTYSPSATGEFFPVSLSNYVSLMGVSENDVILDAEGIAGVMVFNYVDDCTVSDMTLTGGADIFGGGIRFIRSSPTLERITVVGNSAQLFGGGIYCHDSSNPSLNHMTIRDNVVGGSGGGISCRYNSNPLLSYVEITGNTAEGDFGIGGGLHCLGHARPVLDNVTLSENQAGFQGGGIFCESSSTPVLTNCILWADLPQEVFLSESGTSSGITISFSDLQGGQSGIIINNNELVEWLDGNINEDPIFLDPGNGDFHLQPSSPCIDAGAPYSPLDPDGTTADMGAFYYHQTEFDCGYGDFNNDGMSDVLDIVDLLEQIFSFEPPTEQELACGDLDEDGDITIDDLLCLGPFYEQGTDESEYRELIEFTVVDTITYSSNIEFIIPVDIIIPADSFIEALGFDLVLPALGEIDTVYINGGFPSQAGFMTTVDRQNNRIRIVSFSLTYTHLMEYIGRLFDIHVTTTDPFQTTPVIIENIHVNGGCTEGNTSAGNDGMLGVIDSTRIVYLESGIMGEEYSEVVEFPFEPNEGFFGFVSVPDWLDIDIGFENTYQLTLTGIPPIAESNYTEEIIITYPDDWGYWALILPIIDETDLEHFTNILNGYENDYIEFNDSTGLGIMPIYILNAGDGVDIGDEIGLFDYNGITGPGDCPGETGSVLVGATVYESNPFDLLAYGAVFDCDGIGVLPGFVVGNDLNVRIWNSARGVELDGVLTNGTDWDNIFSYDGGEILTVSVDYSALTLGDVNFDGTIDVLDVVMLVDAILGGHEPDEIETWVSDVNTDTVIDVLDIVSLVGIILGE